MKKETKEKWQDIKEEIADLVIKFEKKYPTLFEFLVIFIYSFVTMTITWILLRFILFPLIGLLFRISIVLGLIAIASLIVSFTVGFSKNNK